jgi:serine/threonine protein kinase
MDPGDLIDHRYRLEERTGSGGMAEVWRAFDTRLRRAVAIKILAARFSEDADYLVRFFSEAQSLARVQHPSVVTVLDYGTVDSRPYLVMEYVSGGTLANRTGVPMDPREAVDIVKAVAGAAGAAHARDIVHRDIKPGNILIADGRPKLADFGIASYSGAERLTGTGVTVGSPSYISPEQATDKPITARSDVYALGVVLYELLTGRRPFESDNLPAIVIAHVEEPPQPPSAHTSGIAPALDALVMKCLAKDPARRFTDGTELARALGSLPAVSASGTTPHRAATVTTSYRADEDTLGSDEWGAVVAADEDDPRMHERRRLPARVALVATLIAGTLAGLALLGLRDTTPPSGSAQDPPRDELPVESPRPTRDPEPDMDDSTIEAPATNPVADPNESPPADDDPAPEETETEASPTPTEEPEPTPTAPSPTPTSASSPAPAATPVEAELIAGSRT